MMLFIGILIGAPIGFAISAILNVARSNDDAQLPTPVSKETGDSDARSK